MPDEPGRGEGPSADGAAVWLDALSADAAREALRAAAGRAAGWRGCSIDVPSGHRSRFAPLRARCGRGSSGGTSSRRSRITRRSAPAPAPTCRPPCALRVHARMVGRRAVGRGRRGRRHVARLGACEPRVPRPLRVHLHRVRERPERAGHARRPAGTPRERRRGGAASRGRGAGEDHRAPVGQVGGR